MREFRQEGAVLVAVLWASVRLLNLILAATGSQWSDLNSGMTCCFGLVENQTAFWVICRKIPKTIRMPIAPKH